MHHISTEESYAERRLLFKDIWETAMQLDEKEGDIMNKPKVIKTLRLDEDDKFVIGKRKKERIKNLRCVCKKILDFCDRQDADDKFYEQMAAGPEQEPPDKKLNSASKKLKSYRVKKKTRTARRPLGPTDAIASTAQVKPTTSEKENDLALEQALEKTSRSVSPFDYTRTTIIRRALVEHPMSKPSEVEADNHLSKTSGTRRKVVRKKYRKRKKTSKTADLDSGTPRNINAAIKGRAVLRRVKELLATNKVLIAAQSDPTNKLKKHLLHPSEG